MKSVNKIITVFASACFTLSSCDIDPVLTIVILTISLGRMKRICNCILMAFIL